MTTFIGTVKKEEYVNDEWYYLDVPFNGSIFIDTNKFTDVEKYVNKKIECEVIIWDYFQKGSNKYKVIGKK